MTTKNETFALGNPITNITGKKPDELTREDLIQLIIDNGIERIQFHYTGIDGKIKELKIPIASRQQAEVILTEGERVDGSSLFKGMVDPAKSDLYVVPVYKSAFINPFDEKSLDFVCRFLNPKGELAVFPPDSILQRASAMLKNNTGMELHALGELEFYLMTDPDNEDFALPKQMGYHASPPYAKNREILDEMLHHITQICGVVKYAHSEVGFMDAVESESYEIAGRMAQQVEIEYLPAPIEDMADMLVLSRWIIRNVAFRHGAMATFVPKLEIGHAGSGMHVHMMLKENGKNMMVDDKGVLSETAKKTIGGLCHYATAINAFGNTVASSYLRLVPHQEAPTKVCWSEMNRSALIRVPLGWNNLDNLTCIVNPQQQIKLNNIDSRQTVELRSPDGSCNTHLLMAAITMAVDWGMANPDKSLPLAEKSHVTGDIHGPNSTANDLPELPPSCCESAKLLLERRDLFERDNIFVTEVIDYTAKALCDTCDGDLNERLMKLPDAEKLAESRKAMHKDLHKN